MDSQQLKDSKKKCLLQNCSFGDEENAGTNPSSYEVKFTCCSFFNDPALSDVTLSINDGQLEFFTHRIILSSRSEYFRTLFLDKIHSKSKTVNISTEDEFVPVFESFLKFLYGKPVDVCKENLWLYYFIAEEYIVDDLIKACCAYVRENLTVTKRKRADAIAVDPSTTFTPQEVIDIYEFIKMEIVQGYAASNLMARFDAVPDEIFLHMSKSCFCTVLNSETSVMSERELFQRVVSWLEFDEKRAAYGEDVLSAIRFCHFSKPADIMDAQTNRFVASAPQLVSLVAAGCHYKFMKKELNPEDFAKLQEFKKRQYSNRRYRKIVDISVVGTPSKSGTPPSSGQ